MCIRDSVNGGFWGIYSIREKVSDADYTEYYYGQDKYNVQYVMNWGNTWAQYGGSQAISDWNAIVNYAENHNLSIQSNYEHVADEIDVQLKDPSVPDTDNERTGAKSSSGMVTLKGSDSVPLVPSRSKATTL